MPVPFELRAAASHLFLFRPRPTEHFTKFYKLMGTSKAVAHEGFKVKSGPLGWHTPTSLKAIFEPGDVPSPSRGKADRRFPEEPAPEKGTHLVTFYDAKHRIYDPGRRPGIMDTYDQTHFNDQVMFASVDGHPQRVLDVGLGDMADGQRYLVVVTEHGRIYLPHGFNE